MNADAEPPGCLVMLVGSPASGKSHLARMLVARLGAGLVQSDALRKAIFRPPRYTAKEHAVVYAESHRRLARGLKRGERLIFDATNLQESQRRRVYALADETGSGLVVVVTNAPRPVIQDRLAKRQSGADSLDRSDADWHVRRRLGRPQPVARPHLVVNTAVDLAQIAEIVAGRVEEAAESAPVQQRAGPQRAGQQEK